MSWEVIIRMVGPDGCCWGIHLLEKDTEKLRMINHKLKGNREPKDFLTALWSLIS